MRYAIPEANIESLEKKLTRIKNKCAKYGCEFKYERVGDHFEEKTFHEYDERGIAINKWKEVVHFIDIEVEGTAAVNGWQFVASLDYTEKGNIISSVSATLEVPSRYYTCAPWCEHCKTARDRKHSYIVYHAESGEFKQVGKSCLKDFTGGLSADAVAAFESYLKEIEEAREYMGGWSGSAWFDVKEFMAYVAETIRIYGYVKRDNWLEISTADRAEELFRAENGMRYSNSESARARISDAKSKGFDAKNGVALAEKVREWILASDREDNYFHNLKVACGLEYGGYKVLGLLASAFPTYNRELEYEAEKREREAKEAEARARSSWMGEVGERVTFEVADYYVISSWQTQWGSTTVFRFTSVDGREATWKTSGWVCADDIVGHKLTGTVKELKEYRGVKQTELTRCKIGPKVEKKVPAWVDDAQKAFEEAMDMMDEGA